MGPHKSKWTQSTSTELSNPLTTKRAFLSSARGPLSWTDRMSECKTSLNKFKNIQILPSGVSDHNISKVEINSEKKLRKLQIHGV